MKTLLAGIAALGVAGLVHAHPLVIEESSRIPPPPGVDALWGDVALDGNEAVALSSYSYLDEGGDDYITITSAWLYRRSGTTWTLVGKVGESDDNSIDDATNRNPIAMKNGVLALAFEPMYILEREGGNWVQKLVGPPPGLPYAQHEPVSDVEIDGGRIFNGSGSWGGTIYEKDSVTGNWMARADLNGDYSGDGDNAVGGDVDISPNWAVVASPYNIDDLPAPATHVFQRTGTTPGRCTRDWCPSRVIPSVALPSATTHCSSATSRASAPRYGAAVVRTSGIAPTVCVPPATSPLRDSSAASAPATRSSNLTSTCS